MLFLIKFYIIQELAELYVKHDDLFHFINLLNHYGRSAVWWNYKTTCRFV